ncbi:MAG: HigA family addiction module antitoxin [Ghiorsea sp.]
MMNNHMRPIHAGEILREEFMQPLGITANALAMRLRVPAPRINDIVREKRGISTDTAIRLARCFNTTPEFWLHLQASFELSSADMQPIMDEVQPIAA